MNNVLTVTATVFCLALAFSSMLLSWYILMPRPKHRSHQHHAKDKGHEAG
jgi:hypothetical protein